jgi:predicted metal-binding membrane protein
MSSARPRTLPCIATLLFAISASITAGWCASMAAMGDMPMPGGWTMPDQTWPGAAAAFLGMWVVMMVAMMTPSLTPVLLRLRGELEAPCAKVADRVAGVATGYFAVWTLFGSIAYVVGVTLAALEMQHPELARAVPVAAGIVIVIAGTLQFSRWKARHLACCRQMPLDGDPSSLTLGAAIREGLQFGVHCGYCCLGLTTVLLVIGVMDVRAMACVAVAITVERLASDGERTARAIGVVIIGGGLFLIARAITV